MKMSEAEIVGGKKSSRATQHQFVYTKANTSIFIHICKYIKIYKQTLKNTSVGKISKKMNQFIGRQAT